MNKRVLVIAAHSDDETLGCGATLAKFSEEGDQIRVVFMTDGVSSRGSTSAEADLRKADAKNALDTLGVSDFINYNFPDNKLDQVAMLELAKVIEKEIEAFKPSLLISHFSGDLNIDHQRVAEAVLVATRPQPSQCVKEIWAFEVLSSTEWFFSSNQNFIPNYFVDVKDYIETKLIACSKYEQEFKPSPHSRSLDHVKVMAQHRGFSVGCEYAEAFQLVRGILN